MIALRQLVTKFGFATQHSKIGLIGLEFSINKMYLVQLEQDAVGEIVLRASTAVAYPSSRKELLESPKALKTLLQQALNSAPFSGRKIVTTLPSHDIRMMSVAYQVAKGESETEAILKLLVSRIEDDLMEYVIDYLPIRSHARDDERLALIAMAKRDIVFGYLEALRVAGVSVEALDIAPSAINRLVSTLSDVKQTENILIINFGRNKSYITLISGQRLLSDQVVEFGEAGLISLIATSLDLTYELARELMYVYGLRSADKVQSSNIQISDKEISETLVEIVKPKFLKLVIEINRALIYAVSETRGEPVKKIYLMGSIARWRGSDSLLNQLVNIPVSLPNFLDNFGHAADCDNDEDTVPETAVATGLALRGMTSHV